MSSKFHQSTQHCSPAHISSGKYDDDYLSDESSFETQTKPCVVFVSPVGSKFPDSIQSGDLYKYFRSKFGRKVVYANICRTSRTKKSKGFGRVKFATYSIAKEAIDELNENLFLGQFPLYIGFQRDPSTCQGAGHTLSANPGVPFQCTPVKMMYLCYCFFDSHMQHVSSLKKALPAKVIDKGGYFHLVGSKDEIKSSCGMLDRFISDLKHQNVSYDYHDKFESILKSFIPAINQSQPNVTCILQTHVGARITVNMFSHEMGALQSTSRKFEELKPQRKTQYLRTESNQIAGLYQCIDSISKQHQTLVERRDRQSIIIYGLTSRDIEDTWKGIRESIDSTVVTKNVTVTVYQLKYLQAMHADYLKQVQTKCELAFPLFPEHSGSLESKHKVAFKGKIAVLEPILEEFKKLNYMCKLENCSVKCPQKHLRMWKKRWETFSESQKNEYGVYIEYTSDSCRSTSSDELIKFTLYGNVKGVQQAKQAIENTENGQRTRLHEVRMSDQEFHVLQSSLSKMRNDLEHWNTTYLETYAATKQVFLVVPFNSCVNLMDVELRLKSLISPRSKAIDKKMVVCDRPVGHLLSTRYVPGLSKSVTLKGVKISTSKNATDNCIIQLQGNPDEVKEVETFFKACVKHIKSEVLTTMWFPIPPGHGYASILSSAKFTSYISTLQKELGIACYCHTQKRVLAQSQALCSGGRVCSVQLCEGSLLEEKVDAVIAPTDVHLDTSAYSITKEIATVAGPDFKKECSDYLQENTLRFGDSVEMDCENLPFHTVILAIVEQSRQVLVQAVQKAFQTACESRIGSLSISPMTGILSSIIFTRIVLDVIDSVIKPCAHSALHTIRIVLPPNQFDNRLSSRLLIENYQKKEKISAPPCHSALHTTKLKMDTKGSCSNSLSSPKQRWLWQGDSKYFVEYSQEITEKLSFEFKANPTGTIYLTICKRVYKIDFGSMTQINCSTMYTRKMKCDFITQDTDYGANYANSVFSASSPSKSPVVATSVRWLYKDDTCQYVPYTHDHSHLIEKMHNGQLAIQPLRIGQWTYMFDFERMRQTNTKTNCARPIQREENKPTPNQMPTADFLCDNSQEYEHYIGLRGEKASVDVATQKITTKLQSLTVVKSTTLPSGLSMHTSRLKEILQKHKSVYIHKEEQHTGRNKQQIMIEGEEYQVKNALIDIQEEIIKYSPDQERVSYPDEWQPQKETCKLFDVSRHCREYMKISTQFQETMADYKILSIKRVQNKWLWERYQRDMERMRKKNQGAVNEMSLFHGSRTTSADVIVHSEEGFDMRFSSVGMWGRANYFAVKASYSDTYAYQHSVDHTKELFVAKVLTGDSITLSSDSSLRMPPEKESFASNTEIIPKKIRYDTVNGETHGSKVYMTYSNDKAYPAYIIMYKKGRIGSDSTVRASRTAPKIPFPQSYAFGNTSYL